MAKRGPKGYDRNEVLPRIYQGVASGRSLYKVIHEDDGMPDYVTFWRWHMEDEEIRNNLARARENGVERLMDECVDIADTPQEGVETEEDADGEVVKAKRADMIAHRRLRIETRLKYAQMIAPRKYGAKVDLTTDGRAIDLAAAILAGNKRVSSAS